MKRVAFFAVMFGMTAVFLLIVVAVFLPRIEAGVRPMLLQHIANNLTAAERNAIVQQIAQGTSFWDAVPDPDVAGLAQRSRTVVETGTEVRINNAGLRAARDYTAKPAGVFRILCLGDSFVFGTGGLEGDRFCDQLETFYREHGVTAGGQPIETYAIGLPGWTLVQSATYLATRITSYDPDLVIVLSVANDITDNIGVNGVGALSYGFSPEYRTLGSAVFSSEVNFLFGVPGERSALAWDLSPESRHRWDKALLRLKRLVEIQQGRGKQILVSAMAWGPTDRPDDYAALFHAQFARVGIPAPFVMTSFLPGRETSLPHDNHPNQLGHRLLRDQYVHALHRMRWVTVPDTALPALHQRTPVRLNPALDSSRVEAFRRSYLHNFGASIDFTALRSEETRALLGGVFPESGDPARTLKAPPWASLRAAFLLRRPTERPLQGVEVEIEIPARPELFPFSLRLLVDGAAATAVRFERPNDTGRYRIAGAPVAPPFYDRIVEVTLETSSYFSTIDDARMKSYRLLRARAF